MSGKYGFNGGIELPKSTPTRKAQTKADGEALNQAVQAGNNLGFVSREPTTRLKPGPRRKEAQDKVSIPGPKRVTDEFRAYCTAHELTLWQGLERLLRSQDKSS